MSVRSLGVAPTVYADGGGRAVPGRCVWVMTCETQDGSGLLPSKGRYGWGRRAATQRRRDCWARVSGIGKLVYPRCRWGVAMVAWASPPPRCAVGVVFPQSASSDSYRRFMRPFHLTDALSFPTQADAGANTSDCPARPGARMRERVGAQPHTARQDGNRRGEGPENGHTRRVYSSRLCPRQ